MAKRVKKAASKAKQTAKKVSSKAGSQSKVAAKKVVSRSRKAAAKAKGGSKTTKSKVSKTASRKQRKAGRKAVPGQQLKKYTNHKVRKHQSDTRRRRKAEYLSTLPKTRWKRFIYRLHPKHFFQYWFSKEGLKMALKLSVVSFILLTVTIISVFAYFRRDLPDPTDIRAGVVQSTKFYDRTGQNLLYEVYGNTNRTVVEFDNISQHAKNATVAIEDKDFYSHGGFSIRGIIRATWNNLTKGSDDGVQGGSTLTQQFIKNAVEEVGNERVITRKIKELILSMELERLYSKDEILGFYLNEISYGAQVYGIEAASQTYFDKESKDLTLDEAAMLAAMPQAPSYYSPYGSNLKELKERQDLVITLMQEQGYVSSEKAEEAKKVDTLAKLTPIEEQSLFRNIKAPHFVLEVQDRLIEEFGENVVKEGGLTVTTTLDLELQEIAEQAIKDGISTVELYGGDNTALTSTDVKTGQVLSYVGSRDFLYPGYGNFDAANPELGRQPGSSFKPFAYAELIKNERWSPGSIIWDSPTTFPNHGNWTPQNHSGRFFGPMSMRAALAESRNIPAAKAIYMAGVDQTVDLSRAMGNHSLCETTSCSDILSIVLGAGEVKLAEHTHAYSTFARGGVHKEQAYVLKVENSSGEVIKEWSDTEGEQVLDPEVAYLVSDMLADEAARARLYGGKINTGYNVASKTGTTDNSVDGWLMGYSTCLATGVWVGNADNTPMSIGGFQAITSSQTVAIWTPYIKKAHEKLGCGNDEFQRPDGIKTVSIDSRTGRNASPGSKNVKVDLAPSWFVGISKGDEKKVTIDTVSEKLATNCTPERAKKVVTNTGIAPELPAGDPYAAIWAKGAGYTNGTLINENDDVHKCTDKKPNISISLSKIAEDEYDIIATVTKGTHPMDFVEFFVDGDSISKRSLNGSGSVKARHTFDSTGNHTIRVEAVDDVLYDNSASQSVNVTSLPGSQLPTITNPTGGTVPAGANTISWLEVGSADEYRVCVSENLGVWDCSQQDPELNESEVVNLNANSDYNLYIIAKENGSEISRSAVVSVSAQ